MAAIELALVAPVFVVLLLGIADFSIAYHQLLQLSSVLAAGAQYAFTRGQSETGPTLTTDVKSFVTSVSPIALSTFSLNYNNGLNASSCYCISGSTPTYSSAMTCGATCTDGSGSTAGKYVSISGSFTYIPMFSLDHMFFTSPLRQTVMVRLQ